MTAAVRVTLQALLDTSTGLYGLQICDRTELRTGTIYPLLGRLASAGWITSHQEDRQTWQERTPPSHNLRSRRTYHTLTQDGSKAALHELSL